MKRVEKLTDSEEIVMKAVWDCKKEPTLSDVLDRVNDVYGKRWMPQTVSTFLHKLVIKGYCQLIKNGKLYTYKILIKESEYRRSLYRQHISFWNNNDIVEFVAEMIKNGDLSIDDIEKAKKLAE